MTDKSHQCVIIGIAGASASGKSLCHGTLYRELREQVVMSISVSFPKIAITKTKSPSVDGRARKTNYDHPNAMDHSLLFQHLQTLKRGKRIELPVYSCVEHARTRETIISTEESDHPEGILLLTDAPSARIR